MNRITPLTLLLVLTTILFSCNRQTTAEDTIVESVLIDKTDSSLANPDPNEIWLPLHIEENKWDCVNLRIQTITNYEYNRIYDYGLEPKFKILSNPTARDNEIDSFKSYVGRTLSKLNGEKGGRPQSSIYRLLMADINRVSQTKAHIKSVIAYTDAAENSYFFSIYSSQNRIALKEHPDEVKEYFESKCKPYDLHGVDVYFIFQPNAKNNENFMLMSSLFKSILESAGAHVYIGANLIASKE